MTEVQRLAKIMVLKDLLKEYELLAKYNGGTDYDRYSALDMAIRVLQEPKTETLKQIREEIACAMDMEPAWKGQDNYVGGLEVALSIIDKTLSEVSK